MAQRKSDRTGFLRQAFENRPIEFRRGIIGMFVYLVHHGDAVGRAWTHSAALLPRPGRL